MGMVKVKVENQKVMVKNQKKVEMAINQEVEKVNGKNGEMMMIGKVMMMMTTTSRKEVKVVKVNTISRKMVVMVKEKVEKEVIRRRRSTLERRVVSQNVKNLKKNSYISIDLISYSD